MRNNIISINIKAEREDQLIEQFIMKPELMEFRNNLSERVMLAVVESNGMNLKYINNATEKVQLAAIEQNGNSIMYIKNPTEDMKYNSFVYLPHLMK